MKSGEMREVHLHEFHLRLSLTRGQTAFLLSAAFLALLTSPIATEQVTLTTYYPAPAGAYNNMVTIGNTWLARDNVPSTGQPSFVELGSNAGVSPGTKLSVMNGEAQFWGNDNSNANPGGPFWDIGKYTPGGSGWFGGSYPPQVGMSAQYTNGSYANADIETHYLGINDTSGGQVVIGPNTSPNSVNVDVIPNKGVLINGPTGSSSPMLEIGSGGGGPGTIKLDNGYALTSYFGSWQYTYAGDNTGYPYFSGNGCSMPDAVASDGATIYVCVPNGGSWWMPWGWWEPIHYGIEDHYSYPNTGSQFIETIYSPPGNGWKFVTCPAGTFLTGMQISMSDTWQGICSAATSD